MRGEGPIAEISRLGSHPPPLDGVHASRPRPEDGASFKDVLGGFLKEVNELQLDVDETIKKFAAGEIADVHQVTIAVEEAGIAFQLMMKIRGKLLKAYEEIMKMQV